MSGKTGITGSQVKDETLTGADVLDDSLTKDDIQNFNLSNLDDTTVSSPATDEVLTYNGTNWINAENFGKAAIFPISIVYAGLVNDGTFYGYTDAVNGLDSPIPVQRNSILKVLTFTNSRSNADYNIVLRKNSSTATPFLTISKTNTQTFVFDSSDNIAIEESFNAGDIIYIQHVATGQNPRDVGMTLNFAAVS